MPHFTKKLTLLALFSLSIKSYGFSRVHDYETTRLKSTSGAGVGSILLEEAAILNPASISFFNQSSIYASKTNGKFTIKENSAELPEKNDLGIIISDSNPTMSGTAHYIKTEEGFSERKRFGLTLSSIIGKKSAMGFAYRKTTDTIGTSALSKTENKYQQMSAGVLHVVDPQLTFGAIIIDPFKTNPKESKAYFGFQYNFMAPIAIIGDMGSKWDEDLSGNLIYRGALQFTVFNDFYIRVGMFNDKGNSERGNSIGAAWVQPRLSLDFAIKNTKILANTLKAQNAYDLKETTFGLSLRF